MYLSRFLNILEHSCFCAFLDSPSGAKYIEALDFQCDVFIFVFCNCWMVYKVYAYLLVYRL